MALGSYSTFQIMMARSPWPMEIMYLSSHVKRTDGMSAVWPVSGTDCAALEGCQVQMKK